MKVVYNVNGIIEINLDTETAHVYKLSCDKEGF